MSTENQLSVSAANQYKEEISNTDSKGLVKLVDQIAGRNYIASQGTLYSLSVQKKDFCLN
jgi:hypothetical protein